MKFFASVIHEPSGEIVAGEIDADNWTEAGATMAVRLHHRLNEGRIRVTGVIELPQGELPRHVLAMLMASGMRDAEIIANRRAGG